MRALLKRTWWQLVFLVSGSGLFLSGCDPTLRTTVEDGIINTSASLLGTLIRAAIELAAEGQST